MIHLRFWPAFHAALISINDTFGDVKLCGTSNNNFLKTYEAHFNS